MKEEIVVKKYKTKLGYYQELLNIFLDYPEMFYKEDVPVIKQRLKENSTTDYPKLVATVKDKVVGFISCTKPWDSQNIWFLSWFAVARDLQNLGIGTRLMKEIEKIVTDSSTPHMYVYTSGSKNEISKKTLRFYRKCGYKMVGRIPKFYSNVEDQVIFYKDLH